MLSCCQHYLVFKTRYITQKQLFIVNKIYPPWNSEFKAYSWVSWNRVPLYIYIPRSELTLILTDLKFRGPPTSDSQVLELRVCTIMTGSLFYCVHLLGDWGTFIGQRTTCSSSPSVGSRDPIHMVRLIKKASLLAEPSYWPRHFK